MKISTRGRYGLRAMLYLSGRYGRTVVSLNEISEKENISMNYLEQIFINLRKAELVTSVRGAKGGYSLARPPEMISVSDVLSALEGSLNLVGCLDDDVECAQADSCATRLLWRKMTDAMEAVAASTSLKDLLDETAGKKACQFY